MRRISVVLAALVLGACSWSDVLLEEVKSLPAASSFGYVQGYEAGCKTGIARRGGIGFDKPRAVRDDARVPSEPDYKAGWETGERNCAERYAGPVLVRRGLD